jgi:hypothetical protein
MERRRDRGRGDWLWAYGALMASLGRGQGLGCGFQVGGRALLVSGEVVGLGRDCP